MNILRNLAGSKGDGKMDGIEIGGYRLRAKIGSGWLGEVWEAEHLATHDVFAIKLLHTPLTLGEGFEERFFAVGRNLQELRSRHIVTVHEAGRDPATGHYFIVMDLVRGPQDARYGGTRERRGGAPCTLLDLLQGNEAYGLPEYRVSRWAVQIAKALACAHAQGLSHRDLKPSNVLIDENGDALVTDFAWLKAVGASSLAERRSFGVQPGSGNASMLEGGANVGSGMDVQVAVDALLESAESMSPEQRGDLPGEAISSASDVYAFGVLLYQMLTGRRPKGIPAPIRRIVPELSRRWDRICGHCLQHIVRNRYPSGAELLKALPSRSVRRWTRYLTGRNVAIAAAVVFLLALIVVPVTLSVSRRRAERIALAEQALAQAQAEQARIVDLMQQADVALAEGRVDDAGAIIATLETNELARVVLVGLRDRYAARLGEQQSQTLFAEASEVRAQVQMWQLDGIAAMNTALAGLESHWRSANGARQTRRWDEAARSYKAVLEIGGRMQVLVTTRAEAQNARTAMDEAREAASAVGSVDVAVEQWNAGEEARSAAEGQFEAGEYALARDGWRQATASYQGVVAHVKEAEAYREAYVAFQDAVEGARELLDEHGGESWLLFQQAVAGLQRDPEAPEPARKAVADFTGHLVVLIEAAEQAERAQAVSVLYDRAVAAAEKQLWREVEEAGRALLRLDPEHKPMRQLYDDARYWLVPTVGHDWISPSTGMLFAWVPELGMWVGRHEVTNAEYRKMEPEHDSTNFQEQDLNGDSQPVVLVDFYDAQDYAEWLCMQDLAGFPELAYRLPAESEWVALASCGQDQDYPWGEKWPPQSGLAGNYSDATAREVLKDWSAIRKYRDGFAVSAPVDELWENAWGLRGIGGNVWEACSHDEWPDSFGAWKGASWSHYRRFELSIWHRGEHKARDRNQYSGFRLVLSPR